MKSREAKGQERLPPALVRHRLSRRKTPVKAAVHKERGRPFQIESVPEPVIGPDEVLVQTRTCGICRTDLHIPDGLACLPALPHIAGHEPPGVVPAVEANVRGLEVGRRGPPFVPLE